MSKVTIYILNFNYARYLERALQSVLAQNYSDLEILLIDDGSTDNSSLIYEKYRDRISIIEQKNIGLVQSIKKAFSIATGEYVMRLDADDWLEPDCTQKLVEKLQTDDAAALVFPDYYEVDEFGQVLRRIKRHNFESAVTMFDQPAHGACTLIKRSSYLSVGGHDNSIECQDGVDIWLSLTQEFKVLNVGVPLFYYRRHSESLTNNENRILSTREDIYRQHAMRRGYSNERTVVFIPVRSQVINGNEYCLSLLGGKRVIEWVFRKAQLSILVESVVILADDARLCNELRTIFTDDENVVIAERESLDAGSGVAIRRSIKRYIQKHELNDIENVVILTLDYPFSRHNYIDSAIYAMFLFGSESVDSVVMDNSIFYYHDGSGMKQWVDSDIRRERDDIYVRRGGISVIKKECLINHKDERKKSLGHVIVDKISSHEVRSIEDLQIADFIAKKLMEKA